MMRHVSLFYDAEHSQSFAQFVCETDQPIRRETSVDILLLLKGLHILGIILLLGNVLVTGLWKLMADRTKNPVIISFAQRQVTVTEYVFTGTGAALVLFSGITNAALQGKEFWYTSWMAWSVGLFAAAAVIWVGVLIPVQVKQARMAREAASGRSLAGEYWRLAWLWYLFGSIAAILLLMPLYWMVFKPA